MAKWKNRPRLSRGWKTLRNLVLATVCLFALWAYMSYPLPTLEMRFRRTERENLLAQPTEILGRAERDREIWLAGVNGDQVVLYQEPGDRLWFYERREGGTILALLDSRISGDETFEVMAVDGPEEAVSARLTLRLQGEGYVRASENGSSATYDRVLTRPDDKPGRTFLAFDETYEVWGERAGNNAFDFQVEHHYPDQYTREGYLESCLMGSASRSAEYEYGGESSVNWRMEVAFYDEVGSLLGTAERADWIDPPVPGGGGEVS